MTQPCWNIEVFHQVISGSTTPSAYETNANILQTHLTYLYNTYGPAGNKSLWFAPAGEVMDYLFTRDSVTFQVFAPGTPTNTVTPGGPTSTSTPTATATATETATPCATILYDGETASTNLAAGGTWESAGTTIIETASTSYSPTHSMEVNFVWTSGYWAGGGWNWEKFATGAGINLSAASDVIVWIKGGSGSFNSLTLQLVDSAGITSTAVNPNSYLAGGINTTWQQVTIPLSAFNNGVYNVNSVAMLNFSDGGTAAGNDIFYFDDLAYGSTCAVSTPTPSPTSTVTVGGPTATFTTTVVVGCPSAIQYTTGVAANGHNATDIVQWTDASGNPRTVWLVQPIDVNTVGTQNGGYITRMAWMDGGAAVTCNEDGPADTVSGWGQLINHSDYNDGSGVVYTWANSRTEGYNGAKQIVYQGANAMLVRYTFNMYPDVNKHARGSWACTVDYMFRNGRNDILWAATWDSSSVVSGTFTNDSRSPYCDFDWMGSGSVNTTPSGIEMGADYKFISTDTPGTAMSANTAWTFNTVNPAPAIPYCSMYNDASLPSYPDREIGFIQTETQAQHPGGGGYGITAPTSGSTIAPLVFHRASLPDE